MEAKKVHVKRRKFDAGFKSEAHLVGTLLLTEKMVRQKGTLKQTKKIWIES